MAIRFLIFFSIVLLWQRSLSQEQLVVKGRIQDKTSGIPINDVNIKLKDMPEGTTSSKEGTFSLRVKSLPAILVISHVGYNSKMIEITDQIANEINIQLEKQTQELDEFIVTGNKLETVYKDDVYSVLDYEFLANDILMLVYKNSFFKELVLLNTLNDTITRLNSTDIKPMSLYKDCFGTIHVLTRDLVYQLYYNGQQIELLYPTPLKEFEKLVYPCISKLNNQLYFRRYLFSNLMVEYFYAQEGEGQFHLLRNIADTIKTDLIKSNPYIPILLGSSFYEDLENRFLNAGNYTSSEAQKALLDEIRKAEVEERYLKSIIFTPVYAPLLKIHDTISILNHPQGQIEFYSRDNRLTKTIQINYFNDPDWVKEMIVDDITSDVYTLFLNSGVYNIRKVNTWNGKVEQISRIYYPFAKEIKVRDGFVYYLYKGLGEGENIKLFRQKLN
jgi:hypothetical protein